MARIKPEIMRQREWDAFEAWANEHHVGDHPMDYLPWMDCFIEGMKHGLDVARQIVLIEGQLM